MCPYCQAAANHCIKKGTIVSKTSPHQTNQRYFCKNCRKWFSATTFTPFFRERKPEIKREILPLIVSGVSQRRIALLLKVRQHTVAGKIRLLAKLCQMEHKRFLAQFRTSKEIMFDEMETFEHTKCKPLSIVVSVCPKSRLLLTTNVARMPAKGKLAAIARKKYGFRKDERNTVIKASLKSLKASCQEDLVLKSDQCPRYPSIVKEIFPKAVHATFKGRRGCIVGQGELKRGGYDPLFALNHTCAMLRDNLKRLSRRTWCTTKKPEMLQNLLLIYMVFHNAILLGKELFESFQLIESQVCSPHAGAVIGGSLQIF